MLYYLLFLVEEFSLIENLFSILYSYLAIIILGFTLIKKLDKFIIISSFEIKFSINKHKLICFKENFQV